MDRCLVVAQLALGMLLCGCSTSQTFVGKVPCRVDDSTCGEVMQEGCDGCTGEGRSRRSAGLAGGFERGRRNRLLDGAGWIVGIPAKLILWNTKIDSHSVSPETEQQLRNYLAARGLHDVKVRVNQYDPMGEWKRLANNQSIHAGWRYTFGALAVAKYSLLPGRLFGGDEYNPFTNSISLFSDRATIALREGAHAKSALEAKHRGLYSTSMYMPGSPLWIDNVATKEVLAYSRETNQPLLQRESYLVLFPSYGARLGQSLTLFVDVGQGQLAQAGFAMIGHTIGRTKAVSLSESPMQVVKSLSGIVKRPDTEPQPTQDTVEIQNPLPLKDDFHLTFVPLDVTYDATDENI